MSKVIVAVLAVAAVLLVAKFAAAQHDDSVAGYLNDAQEFPDIMKDAPTCADVYSDFLNTAQKIEACKNLDDAKHDLSTQQALAKQLRSMPKCKACAKKAIQADEAAAVLNDDISVYDKQCPDNRSGLLNSYNQKIAKVCKKCHKKWPGKLGPFDKTPCD
jgi:hypothetical protein